MLLIKKRYIFLIIIICLFSISAASAEEMDKSQLWIIMNLQTAIF